MKADIHDVSTSMLNTVIEDWDLGDSRRKNRWYKNLEKLFNDAELSKEVEEGKLGILLPSTNYETYIFIKNGAVYISTSNNYDWEFEQLASFVGYGSDGGDEDRVHKHVNDVFYYDVRSGKIVSHEQYCSFKDDQDYYCSTCKMTVFSYFVVRGKEDKEICGQCRKTVVKKLNKKK
jgi:hypothetical protein